MDAEGVAIGISAIIYTSKEGGEYYLIRGYRKFI